MKHSAVISNDMLRMSVTAERGEIRSLTHVPTGEELLFQAPWNVIRTRQDLHSSEQWTGAWRGGWTLLFPNAGEPCVVLDRLHGFHGAASLACWRLRRIADQDVLLTWRDSSGLDVRRTVRLRGSCVEVVNDITNRSDASQPFLLVEHVIFGDRVAGKGARISAPGAEVAPLDDAGQSLGEPERSPTEAHWDDTPDTPFSRFGAMSRVRGRAVSVERDGLEVTVTWTGLPCLWFWHESGASRDSPAAKPDRLPGDRAGQHEHGARLDARTRPQRGAGTASRGLNRDADDGHRVARVARELAAVA